MRGRGKIATSLSAINHACPPLHRLHSIYPSSLMPSSTALLSSAIRCLSAGRRRRWLLSGPRYWYWLSHPVTVWARILWTVITMVNRLTSLFSDVNRSKWMGGLNNPSHHPNNLQILSKNNKTVAVFFSFCRKTNRPSQTDNRGSPSTAEMGSVNVERG